MTTLKLPTANELKDLPIEGAKLEEHEINSLINLLWDSAKIGKKSLSIFCGRVASLSCDMHLKVETKWQGYASLHSLLTPEGYVVTMDGEYVYVSWE